MQGSDSLQPVVSLSSRSGVHRVGRTLLSMILLVTIFGEPVFAQSIGQQFCSTDMATTIKNIFQIIQFGGPLIGGTLAVGSAVAIPTVRRSDLKKELKEIRNQGVIWGVIVAPLATAIIQFILNTVVAGGASCGF